MSHPDFAVPPARRDFTMTVERARYYARALASLQTIPADRPADTLRGCDANSQTPQPAGSVVEIGS